MVDKADANCFHHFLTSTDVLRALELMGLAGSFKADLRHRLGMQPRAFLIVDQIQRSSIAETGATITTFNSMLVLARACKRQESKCKQSRHFLPSLLLSCHLSSSGEDLSAITCVAFVMCSTHSTVALHNLAGSALLGTTSSLWIHAAYIC